MYDNSPRQLYRAFNDSQPALEQNILGGEACMWSEQVAGEAIEGKLWPRGSALGERLWTDPATGIVSHCWKITPKMSYLNCHFAKKENFFSLYCRFSKYVLESSI